MIVHIFDTLNTLNMLSVCQNTNVQKTFIRTNIHCFSFECCCSNDIYCHFVMDNNFRAKGMMTDTEFIAAFALLLTCLLYKIYYCHLLHIDMVDCSAAVVSNSAHIIVVWVRSK